MAPSGTALALNRKAIALDLFSLALDLFGGFRWLQKLIEKNKKMSRKSLVCRKENAILKKLDVKMRRLIFSKEKDKFSKLNVVFFLKKSPIFI